jgi:hypothetical protein
MPSICFLKFAVEGVRTPTINALVDLMAVATFCGCPRRHLQVPPVRHRSAHQPHPGSTGRSPPPSGWCMPTPCWSLVTCSGGSRQSAELGNRWDHLGGGRPVPASRAPHPTDGRPTLQPPQYSAAKSIEAFSARLSDLVDLNTLSTERLAVVDRAIRPTTASLWLGRPSNTSSSDGIPLFDRFANLIPGQRRWCAAPAGSGFARARAWLVG